MNDDIANLSVELQALIDRARAALDHEHDVLDAISERLQERLNVSARFVREFGHLVRQPHQTYQQPSAQEAFERLGHDLRQRRQ